VRLLFDEQLAEDLCQLLGVGFPDSLHIRLLGGGGASDEEIWQLALELLEAIRDPKHERHNELLEWLGGAFDPDAFDAAEIKFDDPRRRWRNASPRGYVPSWSPERVEGLGPPRRRI